MLLLIAVIGVGILLLKVMVLVLEHYYVAACFTTTLKCQTISSPLTHPNGGILAI
jgi:hypothetical protein